MNEISGKGNFFLNLFFSLYAAVCIFPLLLIIAISFTDEQTVQDKGYSLIPSKLSTYAYEFVWKTADSIVSAYGITILVTILGTIGSVLVIALYAYPLSRKDFRYRQHFTFLVFFTMLFNGGMVPWYMVCVQWLHLKNTIWAYIFPYLMNGFYVIIMRTFFSTSVPDSIIESSKIDGAGELRTFFQIVLPLSLPGLATIALFNTLIFWNDWYLPLMFITESKLFNLQYTVYKMLANAQALLQMSNLSVGKSELLMNLPSETSRMAMCVLAVGPIIFAYPFFQNYFIKGLTVGAVKG